MTNIATVLKQEISRLARKEVKAATEVLKKQVSALRHDVAALKRDKSALQKMVAGLERTTRRSSNAAGLPTNENEHSRGRISAAGIKTLRQRLGLTAGELGQLVDASAQSVYKWEDGVKPRRPQLARLMELRAMGKKAVHALLDA